MKGTIVFEINDGMIKFMLAMGMPKRVVMAADVINIAQLTDAQISQRLTQWIKQARVNLREVKVVLLLPRSQAILRHMTLPSHNDDEIGAMIDLQVVNHIPYAREEVEVGHQVLIKTPEGYSKVVAVIIPVEVALRYWKIFAEAHIPVHSMTISSVGLWLLYQGQPNLSSQLGGVIDLDSDRSEICLCHKDYWLSSRDIPIGVKQIQRDGPGEFSKQWQMTRDNMAKEMMMGSVRSLSVLCWGPLPEALRLELDKSQSFTVKVIDLMRDLPVVKSIVWSKALLQESISLAALAGIALSAEDIPVDLIPQDVKMTRQEHRGKRDSLVCIFWGIAAVLMVTLALSVDALKKNMVLANLGGEIELARAEVIPVEAQLRQVSEITKIFQRRPVFGKWAQEIFRLLPAHLSVVNLSLSNTNVLAFEGISANPGEINQLQKAMLDSTLFSDVNLEYVNKRVTQDGEVDYFKISCRIGPSGGDNEKTKE